MQILTFMIRWLADMTLLLDLDLQRTEAKSPAEISPVSEVSHTELLQCSSSQASLFRVLVEASLKTCSLTSCWLHGLKGQAASGAQKVVVAALNASGPSQLLILI